MAKGNKNAAVENNGGIAVEDAPAKKSKKGMNLLADQISGLKSKLTPEQIAHAEDLAKSHGTVVKLAFRLLPDPKPEGLGPRMQKEYENLIQFCGQEAADKWKAHKLGL